MKRLLILVAMAATVPALAFAQGAPPAGMGGPPPAARQRMQQMRTMHDRFRAKILAALTPSHRALLASVVGQLAIAPSPDPRGAASRLDAALSAGEKQAIANAAQAFMTQQRAVREQMMAQFRSAHPNMASPRPMRSGAPRKRGGMDPGRLLLMLATNFGGPAMGGHGFMMERGFGPRSGGFTRRPQPSPSP